VSGIYVCMYVMMMARFGVRSRKLSNVGHSFVTKHLLSQESLCFGRHVKPLAQPVFAIASTHQPALGRVVDYSPFSLCVIFKEGLCPSSGDINDDDDDYD
jgi:hypothetical protein